jgi:hypothetical protein
MPAWPTPLIKGRLSNPRAMILPVQDVTLCMKFCSERRSQLARLAVLAQAVMLADGPISAIGLRRGR